MYGASVAAAPPQAAVSSNTNNIPMSRALRLVIIFSPFIWLIKCNKANVGSAFPLFAKTLLFHKPSFIKQQKIENSDYYFDDDCIEMFPNTLNKKGQSPWTVLESCIVQPTPSSVKS